MGKIKGCKFGPVLFWDESGLTYFCSRVSCISVGLFGSKHRADACSHSILYSGCSVGHSVCDGGFTLGKACT